jgi:hypothetical protein
MVNHIGAAWRVQKEKEVHREVLFPCIEKLFDFMYVTFEDASDDDKYSRTFIDAACSSAPNDDTHCVTHELNHDAG